MKCPCVGDDCCCNNQIHLEDSLTSVREKSGSPLLALALPGPYFSLAISSHINLYKRECTLSISW